MGAIAALAYGLVSYAAFLASFAYAVAFLGGFVAGLEDAGALSPALAANLGLVAAFGVQHSVMARRSVKARLARLLPATIERSTYVLVSSLLLFAICRAWRPIPGTIWHVDPPLARRAVEAAFWAGWPIVVVSTFLIDHWDFVGLRQVWRNLRGGSAAPPQFQVRALYRIVRHPLASGLLLGLWAAPTMTVSHAVFAGGMSAYIVIGTRLEERDLVAAFGERYAEYAREVPRFFPRLWPRARPTATPAPPR
jgi:protein-S-isoprenylcysteine O-methyltransferase Ste14